MPRRNPQLVVLGGGQEFQQQSPWNPLPADLWSGPPPRTQTQQGGGQSSPIDGLAMPVFSAPAPSKWADLPPDLRALLYAVQRRGDFIMANGLVSTAPVLVRAAESRIYLLVQNTSSANQLIIGIGYAPAVVTGGFTGLLLAANGGNYEPSVIPQQDIWLLGSAASTNFVIAVSTG